MSKIVYKKYSIDSKNLSTLLLVLFWLVLGLIVCFVGINKTFAATYYMNYQYQQQYYDNYGSSVNPISTNWIESLQSYVSDNITTVSGSYGAGLSISSPIAIIANHTYSMSIYFEDITNLTSSSKSKIAISTSLSGAAQNYASNNFWADTIQTNVNNNKIIQFVFTANGGGSFIFIPWSTSNTSNQSYVLTEIVMEDLGSEGISQSDINNSLNNQTNTLNNSIQNSTNTITGEINDMEQSIIDSNKETQETIKDQFNSCRDSVNLFNKNNATYKVGYFSADGTLNTGGSSTVLTSYIKITPNTDYTISGFLVNRIVYYDENYNFVERSETISNTPYTFNKNAHYIRIQGLTDNFNLTKLQIQKGKIATEYETFGEQICVNKLDEQNETSKGIWATIKELPSMFLDMLLGLFIPKDLSFIENFKDVISNKLGFIASIPIQIIDFMLGLANVAFEEITTISFPSISIFGFNFWNAEEIDITILLEKLKPFKYFTDFTCVILCCRTLYDFYHSFTGGDVN